MVMIFCRSADAITRDEIAQEITNGVFFEDTPTFELPPGSEESRALGWKRLVIAYESSKRPIVLSRNGPISGIEEDVEDDFDGRGPDPMLLRRLTEAEQVFTLDLDRSSITDEAWEMSDFVEGFIARRLDGVVYAPGDGIFDANLKPLARIATAS